MERRSTSPDVLGTQHAIATVLLYGYELNPADLSDLVSSYGYSGRAEGLMNSYRMREALQEAGVNLAEVKQGRKIIFSHSPESEPELS